MTNVFDLIFFPVLGLRPVIGFFTGVWELWVSSKMIVASLSLLLLLFLSVFAIVLAQVRTVGPGLRPIFLASIYLCAANR